MGKRANAPFHARPLLWDSDRDRDSDGDGDTDGDRDAIGMGMGTRPCPNSFHPTSRNLSSLRLSLSPPTRYLMQRWPKLTGATFSTCRLLLNSPGTSYLAVCSPAHMLFVSSSCPPPPLFRRSPQSRSTGEGRLRDTAIPGPATTTHRSCSLAPVSGPAISLYPTCLGTRYYH
jgi:hypothetical protein